MKRKKKRVLILANNDMGLYKFRKELLEELLASYEVFVCVPEGDFVGLIRDLGCRYISCDVLERRSINPVKDIRLLRFYRNVAAAVKPDVVLTYTIKPNIYGGYICAGKHIPFIANITGLGTSIENGGILAGIATSLYRIGLKKAECVFFQNEYNQKLFTGRKIVRGRTRLIPGSGVNLELNHTEPYPSDKEGVRFLFVGRIMKDKGIEELLQAIREIRRTGCNAILEIVGPSEEDYEKDLEECEKEGAIINCGVQEDVHPFYAGCHAAVLPSYHEGMANVLLEASATGRPVIATRVPGCRETYDEGVTGFGCEVRDAADLRRAMERFLDLTNEERAAMGRAARAKMEKQFDRNLVTGAYKEEISAVFKKKSEDKRQNGPLRTTD